MTARSKRHRIWQRGPLLALSLTVCFGLAACGPLGDDDPEPTETSEALVQPTDATETEVTDEIGTLGATPTDPPADAIQTPDLEPETGTPAVGEDPPSTPVFNDIANVASPISVVATPVVDAEGAQADDGPVPDGDGTSGAVPNAEGTPADVPLLVSETPESENAAGGSPAALVASLDQLAAVTVESCAPESVPPIALESTAYVTNVQLNVRFGPGADCDRLAISPIDPAVPLTIIGGPVERDGDDFVWVQVEVAGEVGWVVIDAIEPAES
jgi:hypothetical protein